MPRALATKNDNARVAPYSKSKSSRRDNSEPDPEKEKVYARSNSMSVLPELAVGRHYSDYRDIELEEILDEIPGYDDATTVRRKFKKLLADKSNIPGTSKSWTQAAMSKEMKELESRDGAVEYYRSSTGPTTREFLEKDGANGR
ncbi:MAG: hypothetical protein Q9226_007402, partial [Calogaya cf. arnoldii]